MRRKRPLKQILQASTMLFRRRRHTIASSKHLANLRLQLSKATNLHFCAEKTTRTSMFFRYGKVWDCLMMTSTMTLKSSLSPSPTENVSQLLRRLRQQENAARHRNDPDPNGTKRGGSRTSRPARRRGTRGEKSSRCATSATTTTTRAGASIARLPFSPADAWDDTGLFTVAPRPKTVPLPSRTSMSKQDRRCEDEGQRRQRPTLETHALARPVVANRGWPSSSSPPAALPGSLRSSEGGVVVGTIAPSELWHKGQDFRTLGGGGSRAASDGFGLWPKRRRKVRWRDTV